MCKSVRSPPCRWQNCCFSPSKSGFKDQHLAGWDGVRCGLHVYQVTHFKDTLPYTASDESRGLRIGPHCYSAIISTARGWRAHFFPPIIIGAFFLSLSSIDNGSEENDPFLWIPWMAPNILLPLLQSRDQSKMDCCGLPVSKDDP